MMMNKPTIQYTQVVVQGEVVGYRVIKDGIVIPGLYETLEAVERAMKTALFVSAYDDLAAERERGVGL